MIQTLIVYAVVALATGWTVWRLFLRNWISRHSGVKANVGCSPSCTCGE